MTVYFLVIGLEVKRELPSGGSATPAGPRPSCWRWPDWEATDRYVVVLQDPQGNQFCRT
jgi:hypothetical protein